jgi:tetratricopeptide (TPR) repeat protein
MRLHYLQGDRAAALVGYERLKEVLRREFGAEPMPETLALAREIERGGRVALAVPAARPQLPLSVLRPPALVGREREWALMEEAWANGQGVILGGLPGVGKTRLAMDFAAGRGTLLLMQGRPGDSNVPYSTHARTLRQALAAFPGLELEPWVRRELARVLPELGEGPPPMTSEAEKLRFFEAEVWLYRQITRRSAVVTVWDDIQFVDLASVEAGHYTYSAFWGDPTAQVRSVMSFRAGELRPELEAAIAHEIEAGRLVLIELEPLPPEAVGELLAEIELPGAAGLAAPLTRYTGGNPLFVLETLRHLFETGQLERGWPGRFPPPGKVGPLVEKRLARLSEPARQLAWAAGVLGADLSLERAARMLGAEPLALSEPWAELEAAQVLRGDAFSHDLVYEGVLAATPGPAGAVLHRAAAEALEATGGAPARVAEHWLAGGDELRAAPRLIEAGRAAEAAYRLPEAADFYGRAADLLEARGEREGAFAAAFEQQRAMGGFDGGPRREAAVERLGRLAHSPASRAQAARALAEFLYHAGRAAEAEAAARAGLTSATEADDPLVEADLWAVIAGALWALGRLEDALTAQRRVHELNERVGDPRRLAESLMNLGVLLDDLERRSEAVEHYGRALAVQANLGDRIAQVSTLNNLAVSQVESGLTLASLETLRQASALLEGVEGATSLRTQCLTALGTRHLELADYAAALRHFEESLALVTEAGLWTRPSVLRSRAAVHLALGRPDLAEAGLEEALAHPNLRRTQRTAALRVRGRLLAQSGGPASADFEEALRLALQGGSSLSVGGAWLDLASVSPPRRHSPSPGGPSTSPSGGSCPASGSAPGPGWRRPCCASGGRPRPSRGVGGGGRAGRPRSGGDEPRRGAPHPRPGARGRRRPGRRSRPRGRPSLGARDGRGPGAARVPRELPAGDPGGPGGAGGSATRGACDARRLSRRAVDRTEREGRACPALPLLAHQGFRRSRGRSSSLACGRSGGGPRGRGGA